MLRVKNQVNLVQIILVFGCVTNSLDYFLCNTHFVLPIEFDTQDVSQFLDEILACFFNRKECGVLWFEKWGVCDAQIFFGK